MGRHLITGSDIGDNLLEMDPRDDLVYAYGGFDNINTGKGNDVIYAGADSDYAFAGEGDDKLFGGDGGDVLNGNEGDDTLNGQAGSDILVGGTGADWLYGGADGDTLYSNAGLSPFEEKHLFGGTGNDRLVFAWNDHGVADGGAGQDQLELTVYDVSSATMADVTVTMTGTSGTAGFADLLIEFTSIEVLYVQTWTGDDTVTAGAGNDTISVDHGANVVDAGLGDDLVAWFTGSANVLDGGLGQDTLKLMQSTSLPALVFSAAGGTATDFYGSTLTGFEQFIVFGNQLGDQAVLGDGADQFYGAQGDDAAIGGLGNDVLHGQLGNDTLKGTEGADRLAGGLGDDLLEGGAGADTLAGGIGSDTLTGGTGADRFRFAAPEQFYDHITDFTHGQDKLVFYSGFLGLPWDAQPSDPGFLALNGPDAAHGQFVFFEDWSELRWDADGTGISGGVTIAILEGVSHLSIDDFVLI